MQGNRPTSEAEDAQRHRPAHVIVAAEHSGLLCSPLVSTTIDRLLRGVCRLLPSGQLMFVWVDSELRLWKTPFLLVSEGSMAIECLFRGRQIKLLKICPQFFKNKILPLLQ